MTTANALGGKFPLGADVTVNRVGFGAMQLAGPGVFGPPADREKAIAVLRRAVELGIDHIDTSDFYGPWVVNELIAEALHPYDSGLVLATKIGAYRDDKANWLPLNHPDALRAQVHDNLRRLKVDVLDLVYLRDMGLQEGIAFTDQVGALHELKEQGLIRNIGLSNVEPDHFREARAITPIAAVQNLYNVVNRTSAELLRATAEAEVGFVPFFPLGSGFTDSRARGDEVLKSVADKHGATQAQVSLAWLLHRSANVLLIPGTSSVGHLEENTAAGRLALDQDDTAKLDALVADGETLEAAH
ncbi:oxidoreductase [Saccharopolyspora rhizosphaerae]|uniref:Oxidoreductase n=1 Tax=Saccharopolyspora rhizosphaerae TaxID=2492662 RepID=A0A426JZ29_9PSEU|nr:oxidoreductase [Saccharopolyspora rhizosphaerae]RRO18356.1 oxidoreductase [Saccharopolyspora rhizosphaerae]